MNMLEYIAVKALGIKDFVYSRYDKYCGYQKGKYNVGIWFDDTPMTMVHIDKFEGDKCTDMNHYYIEPLSEKEYPREGERHRLVTLAVTKYVEAFEKFNSNTKFKLIVNTEGEVDLYGKSQFISRA